MNLELFVRKTLVKVHSFSLLLECFAKHFNHLNTKITNTENERNLRQDVYSQLLDYTFDGFVIGLTSLDPLDTRR